MTGQQLDDLILAQPQLTEAVLKVRRGAKLLDAHGNAGLDPGQRTELAPGSIPMS
jgi:hypothetical protein